jgi:hypothetical protein
MRKKCNAEGGNVTQKEGIVEGKNVTIEEGIP